MKKEYFAAFAIFLLYILGQSINAQEKIVWQIGNSDGSSREFALAPGDYNKFLQHDFGYEDNSFIIGQSSVSSDLPYVLPGPANGWGGTGGTSGLRTHFLTLYYVLNSHKPI